MLYSTKQKLYHNLTISIYILLFIAAAFSVLYAIFGALIPGKQAYAAVKCSFNENGSKVSTYFFVDENDRVNAIAALNTPTPDYISYAINFKNYRINDAVKHFYETAITENKINYKSDSSITFNVEIFTTGKFENDAKVITNSITETTNNFFLSIYKKYSVNCSISTDVESVIYEIAGINYDIKGENQFEIDENKFKALSELSQGIRATKTFTPGNRQDFFKDAYNAKLKYEESMKSTDKQVRKDAKNTYSEKTKNSWESNDLDSSDFQNSKKYFNYDYRHETMPANVEIFNTYISSYVHDLTDLQLKSKKESIQEYQKEHSTIYDLKTGEIVVYETSND